ncbi:TIGR03032 family protein [Parasphingorhabdus sp.]|uniref:TIGR03032 family protein n=1 Tax=Parasphingorhabdus sp. TaxID=2709688 RepID=UPI0032634C83
MADSGAVRGKKTGKVTAAKKSRAGAKSRTASAAGTKAADKAVVADKSSPSTITYSQSGSLLSLMRSLDISLAITSYQSGLFYLLGSSPKTGLHLHECAMPKPMGIKYEGDGRITLAGGYQIMRLEDALAPDEQINNMFDRCFVPRTMHITGALDAHDVGLGEDGQPIFVNTRFNCLATVDPRHSFREIWRPDFISELIGEDRCHLNGLAMDAGKPAYVTAVSKSNTIDGWRDRRSDGGVVIDVQNNRIVCEGLSMPHSPRLHNGELWILNAGTGELGVVEGAASGKGKFVPRIFCPGFLRGLAFHGNHAFVGLSKPRYQRFEGLALDQRLKDADSEAWCGVQVIDLTKNSCVDWFRIDGAVSELYDVEVIPGAACMMSVSPVSAEIANLITYAKSPEAKIDKPPKA